MPRLLPPKLRRQVRTLTEYVLDNQSEGESYEDWCLEHDRDPKDYAANTEHVFALAQVVWQELTR